MLNFGTFLLMQSPSAQSSEEMYARAIEHAETAEALGFRNMWLAEHHFSTYGYVGRPVQLATYLAAKTSKIRVGTAGWYYKDWEGIFYPPGMSRRKQHPLELIARCFDVVEIIFLQRAGDKNDRCTISNRQI